MIMETAFSPFASLAGGALIAGMLLTRFFMKMKQKATVAQQAWTLREKTRG